jgi:hypothetical protein
MKRDVLQTQGIYLTLDAEVLKKIEQAAEQYGVSRQDLIRMWIGEKIKVICQDKKSEATEK